MRPIIKKIHGYVDLVLPQVYDESLSYQELLYKVLAKVNEIIDITNELAGAMDDIDKYIVEHIDEVIAEYLTDEHVAEIVSGIVDDAIDERVPDMIDDAIAEQVPGMIPAHNPVVNSHYFYIDGVAGYDDNRVVDGREYDGRSKDRPFKTLDKWITTAAAEGPDCRGSILRAGTYTIGGEKNAFTGMSIHLTRAASDVNDNPVTGDIIVDFAANHNIQFYNTHVNFRNFTLRATGESSPNTPARMYFESATITLTNMTLDTEDLRFYGCYVGLTNCSINKRIQFYGCRGTLTSCHVGITNVFTNINPDTQTIDYTNPIAPIRMRDNCHMMLSGSWTNAQLGYTNGYTRMIYVTHSDLTLDHANTTPPISAATNYSALIWMTLSSLRAQPAEWNAWNDNDTTNNGRIKVYNQNNTFFLGSDADVLSSQMVRWSGSNLQYWNNTNREWTNISL